MGTSGSRQWLDLSRRRICAAVIRWAEASKNAVKHLTEHTVGPATENDLSSDVSQTAVMLTCRKVAVWMEMCRLLL